MEAQQIQGHFLEESKTEVVENLEPRTFNRFYDGIVNEITTRPVNPQKIIEVFVGGLSLSGKTTFVGQVMHLLKGDARVKSWEKEQGTDLKLYRNTLGEDIFYGRNSGYIAVPDGELGYLDYKIASDTDNAVASLVRQYLDGPAVFFREVVLLSEYITPTGEIKGTPRGSLESAKRALASSQTRLVLMFAEDEMREREANTREKMRIAKKDESRFIQRQAGIVLDSDNPQEVQEFFQRTGNTKAKAAQEYDLMQNAFNLVLQGEFPDLIYEGDTFEDFCKYWRDHPQEWSGFIRGLYRRRFVQTLAEGGNQQNIYVFENNDLPPGVNKHIYVNKLKRSLVGPILRKEKDTWFPQWSEILDLWGIK